LFPDGREEVEMLSGGTTSNESVAFAVCFDGLVESVTVSVTEAFAFADGVPLITPVDASILRPEGRPVADQA
jgi:hypothetical protein